MTQLETIESLVQKTPCPICNHMNYQVTLFCESPGDPCEYAAECQRCGNKILVTEDTRTIDDLLPEIKRHVEKAGCIKCGSANLQIEYLCDKDSKDCFFLARCGEEGHYSRLDKSGIRYLLG